MVWQYEKLNWSWLRKEWKDACSLEEKLTNLKHRHHSAENDPSSQGYGFSSGHVWVWELDYKESWVPKNWCFWIVVLEKTVESPFDCKGIQPVRPKGNQSWIIIGRTDAEAEVPILWQPDAKNCLIWKDSDAGKAWRWEEKGMTQDEIVGWHHWLNGHELGVGDAQGSLVCCSPWGRKELDMAERLSWIDPCLQVFFPLSECCLCLCLGFLLLFK